MLPCQQRNKFLRIALGAVAVANGAIPDIKDPALVKCRARTFATLLTRNRQGLQVGGNVHKLLGGQCVVIDKRMHFWIEPSTRANVSHLLNEYAGVLTRQARVGTAGRTDGATPVTALAYLKGFFAACRITFEPQSLQFLTLELIPGLSRLLPNRHSLRLRWRQQRPTQKNHDKFHNRVHKISPHGSTTGYLALMYSATALISLSVMRLATSRMKRAPA
jgi:hypothetical protein